MALTAAAIYWIMINVVRGGFNVANKRVNGYLYVR